MSYPSHQNSGEPAPGGIAMTPEEDLLAANRLLGRKWQPVIVFHLLENGPTGFSALRSRIDGISSKVLSNNLDELEDGGFVARTVVEQKPLRVEYALTPLGETLEKPVRAILHWSQDHGSALQDE